MKCNNSKNKISQGSSYMQLKKNSAEERDMCNVKISVEGFYMLLVTCIKETAEEGFHNARAT